MSTTNKKSITNVLAWDLVARFLLQGIGFITAPIISRLMTTSDYGQLSTFTAWVGLFSIFIGLQTNGAIGLARVKYDENEFYKFNSSVLFISFISFVGVFLLTLFLAPFLSVKLGFPTIIIPLIALNAFTSYCLSFNSTILVQLKKTNINTAIALINGLLSTVVSILILKSVTGEKYVYQIIISTCFSLITGFSCAGFIFFKGKTFYNKEYWNFCLPITLPLILHGASSMIFNQSDRIMIKMFAGESETGIYSVAFGLAIIISIIWTSCNQVWVPFYYDYKKANDFESIKTKSKNYLFFFTVMTIGFICLAPEVFKVVYPESYWDGIKIIPFIAGAYYFNFIYSFPANYEFYYSKTKVIAFGTMMVALINIVLNYLLIPKYAGMGAAVATFISYVFLFLIHEMNVRFILKAKDFECNWTFYLKGIIPVFAFMFIYYNTLDLWYIRWVSGFLLGIILLVRIIKNRGIF